MKCVNVPLTVNDSQNSMMLRKKISTASSIIKISITLLIAINLVFSLKAALAYGGENDEKTNHLKELIKTAETFYYSSAYDSTIIYADSAVNIAVAGNETPSMARALYFRGVSNFRKTSYAEAIVDLQQSLAIFEANNDSVRMGVGLTGLGVVFEAMSLFEESIKHHNMALQIWLNLNDRSEVVVSLFNISVVLLNSKTNIEEASNHLNRLETEYRDIVIQDRILSNVYNMKSIIMANQNQTDSAIFYSLAAYDHSLEENNDRSKMYLTNNLAKFYLTKGDLQNAEKASLESLALRKKLQSVQDIAYGKLQLAHIYIKRNNLVEAHTLLNECHLLADQIDNVQIKIEMLGLQAEWHERMNNYDEAFRTYKKHTALKDSVFSLESLKQINWMRSLGQEALLSYENELLIAQRDFEKMLAQKEKARRNLMLLFTGFAFIILVLVTLRYIEKGRLNKKLEASEQKLINLNHAKDKFFGILSHDLRSPLMAFESLSNRMTKPDAKKNAELAQQMNHYAKQLINLLNNLLLWSKNEQGLLTLKPQAILLDQIIEESVALFKPIASAKGIQLQWGTTTEIMVFADKESLQTILRNLLNNAVKFTAAGIVSISCKALQHQVLVNITDTGIGMDEQQLYSLYKLAANHHSGLGLLLCKELAEKNGIGFTIESKKDKGTSIKLIIPIFVHHEDRAH